eukprot:gene41981-56845_t
MIGENALVPHHSLPRESAYQERDENSSVAAAFFGQCDCPKSMTLPSQIAVVVWIVLGTTLAGCGLLAILSIETLAAQAIKLIPIAVLGGFVVEDVACWPSS